MLRQQGDRVMDYVELTSGTQASKTGDGGTLSSVSIGTPFVYANVLLANGRVRAVRGQFGAVSLRRFIAAKRHTKRRATPHGIDFFWPVVIRFMRPHSKPMNGRCENNYRAYWPIWL